MSRVEFDSIDVHEGGVVVMQRGGVDQEAMFLITEVSSVEVDWEVASGSILVTLRSGVSFRYTSHRDDGGEECGNLSGDLFTALQRLGLARSAQ